MCDPATVVLTRCFKLLSFFTLINNNNKSAESTARCMMLQVAIGTAGRATLPCIQCSVCQWCSVSVGRRWLVAQPGALLCRASSAVFVSGGAVLVLDALYTVYCLLPPTVRTVSSKPHTLAMHVSFMQRERQGMSVSRGIFLKMCGPYKQQIYGGNMCKYISKLIETNYPISFHRGLDT